MQSYVRPLQRNSNRWDPLMLKSFLLWNWIVICQCHSDKQSEPHNPLANVFAAWLMTAVKSEGSS